MEVRHAAQRRARFDAHDAAVGLAPARQSTAQKRPGRRKGGEPGLRFACSALLSTAMAICAVSAQAGANKTVTYYYTDPQGTPLVVTDAAGNAIQQSDFSPYGKQVLGTAASGPGFTGHANDPESGLVYMQARYYDPDIGRFLSVDVVNANPGDVFSTNMYLYVRASPSMLTDPDGKQARGGKDMEICDGPVPCDQMTSSSSGMISGQYDKIADRVFEHKTADELGKAAASEMPEQLRAALAYIIGSPQGRALVLASLRTGEKISLVQMPASALQMRYEPSVGAVFYTLNIAAYKARYVNSPFNSEVRDQTLDVILMHEFAHTSLGREVFGIEAKPHSTKDELETVRKVENPYRAFYGVPKRETYSGMPVEH
ncbi:MAG TPA: RHS repeat-associated core domain-containing protein [Luteibacter sp.]|uniref:RHS repeat domain-containing protein n=1 Tax=Luteibacter sp. TaxID=1886636 RepID=UPI002C19F86D|nr:RHS repeat-associated core domain-containing protein [Luteibacter sp.]HVI56309.1 RHS repeat-associated core domain-containing protein [Luteibacter sp.]